LGDTLKIPEEPSLVDLKDGPYARFDSAEHTRKGCRDHQRSLQRSDYKGVIS
jgi:hypothetical protein